MIDNPCYGTVSQAWGKPCFGMNRNVKWYVWFDAGGSSWNTYTFLCDACLAYWLLQARTVEQATLIADRNVVIDGTAKRRKDARTGLPADMRHVVWNDAIITEFTESRPSNPDAKFGLPNDPPTLQVVLEFPTTPEYTRWLFDRCFDGHEIAVAFMPKPEAA